MASSRSTRKTPEIETPEWLTEHLISGNKAYENTLGILRASHKDHQELAHGKAELKEARKRNRELESERDEYRDQIFRSIDTFQVSDTSISPELISIEEGLSNWIETLPDSQHFVQNWPEVRKFLEDNGFVTLNFALCPEAIALAETELLTAVTFGILWTILFKPAPFGLSSDVCSYLDVVQTSMSLLEPPRNKAAINSWRSAMFRAWSRSPEYASVTEAECRKASDMILHALRLAGHVEDGHWESRANQLIEHALKPAAALAMRMKCSLEDYCWDWTSQFPAKIQKRLLSTWQCVDLRTHCQIRNQILQNDPGNSVVGDFVTIMFPALYRLIDGEQSRLLIEKGQLLLNTGILVTKIKEEPKSPILRQDHLIESQVKEEPRSPQPTQESSLPSDITREPFVGQVPRVPVILRGAPSW